MKLIPPKKLIRIIVIIGTLTACSAAFLPLHSSSEEDAIRISYKKSIDQLLESQIDMFHISLENKPVLDMLEKSWHAIGGCK